MTTFHRRALASAALATTAVLAAAGAASADSVGNSVPGLGLLSPSFGKGEHQAAQPHQATQTHQGSQARDALPTHDALNNVTLP
ncbi:hypothetical protein AB0G79_13140 [Streptomyces sp. NPDC020807]|uniref:hypothetical protein n=1 Tax=Streptomyces sp. NPDC020807 TaxID=3155119 RepID=UPI0034010C43